MQVFVKFFSEGGLLMYPITALFILGWGVIIERLYKILYVYKGDAAWLMQKVQRCILDNNLDEAVKLCSAKTESPIYQVFKAALVNADRPFEEIQEQVEVATLGVVPRLQRRMPYLFTIGNVATLFGLMGTIFGLIQTFDAVGGVEGSQKQALLSAGIATALNATAFGLSVAIPTMLVYGFLFNKINTIVEEVEHYSARLLLLLRTGREYFDNFKDHDSVSTEQTPRKKQAGTNAA